MKKRLAVQFPGLGGYTPGILAELVGDFPEAADLLAEVDRAGADYHLAPVSGLLVDPGGPPIEELALTPTLLHLSALASSLVLYRALEEEGVRGDVLLGHSTGELTALAAAGCLSVHDAARVLCEREVALADGDFRGGLTALRISRRRAEHLCGAVGGWTLQPSLFNAPQQTVVSGDEEELPRLEKAARALGIQTSRLLVVYPHHNPMLAPAARQLAEATATYRIREPRVRVFSPLLRRLVRDTDDVRRIVDRHLTDTVEYAGAVRELHSELAVETFIEVGARPILTEFARECLPRGPSLLGPPPGVTDARKILRTLAGPTDVTSTRGTVQPAGAPATGVTPRPAPPQSDDAPTAPTAVERRRRLPGHAALGAELREIFAAELDYPADVLTDDAHLEADLGIASVKKTELLVHLLDRYDLPTPPANLRIRDYNTLAKLVDLIELLADESDEVPA